MQPDVQVEYRNPLKLYRDKEIPLQSAFHSYPKRKGKKIMVLRQKTQLAALKQQKFPIYPNIKYYSQLAKTIDILGTWPC
jgi:hypothetical protein